MKKNILIILITISFLISCNKQRQIQFDREMWLDIPIEGYIIPKERYGMTLWLKDNYQFCGKTHKEICDKLGNEQFITKNSSANEGYMKYVIKQESPFLIGIDFHSLSVLLIYFRNDKVIKAVLEERKTRDMPFKETILVCEES